MKFAAKSFVVILVILLSWNLMSVAAQTADNQKESGKTLININTANQAELERLPGIGPSLAKKIIEFRQKNGNFKTTSDIVAVQGIGERKFEQIKNLITVK